mgnify:CR=1 FL=1
MIPAPTRPNNDELTALNSKWEDEDCDHNLLATAVMNSIQESRDRDLQAMKERGMEEEFHLKNSKEDHLRSEDL